MPRPRRLTRAIARTVLDALIERPEEIRYQRLLDLLEGAGVRPPVVAVEAFLREANDIGATEVVVLLSYDLARELAFSTGRLQSHCAAA